MTESELDQLAKDRELMHQTSKKTVADMESKCQDSLDKINEINRLQNKSGKLRAELETALEQIRYKVASFRWVCLFIMLLK